MMETKFDLWLKRAGYITQICILFIMIFTIFHSVIPLYQNASLQESIARKEIELSKLSKKVKQYEQMRRDLTIGSFFARLGFDCTFISDDPNARKKSKAVLMEPDLLNRDIEGCIKNSNKYEELLDSLNSNEQKIFRKHIQKLIDSVAEKRKLSLLTYYEQKKLVDNNNVDFPPEDEIILTLREIGMSDKDILLMQKERYLRNIEYKLEDEIRTTILNGKKIDWGDET
ncbi:hypothetical protein ACLPIF_20640 [Providencia sp. Me1]|uniref:hypothetical protein n=1 Tax=Providencia sp. Me1 TaxID=3392634 RepID=UPI003D29E5F7